MKTSFILQVQGIPINVIKTNQDEYVSLTDIVNRFGDDSIIYSWMRNRNTVEFLGIREKLYNPNFKGNEFVTFKNQAGLNSFNLTPQKWIRITNAIGFVSKSGRYGGGTYAHKDIAIKFASRISPEFELYLIKEFQRLKEQEINSLDWNVKRFISKMNYRIHTDAIKEKLIPKELSLGEMQHIYANEADVLNKALFGITAQERKEKYPHKEGNIRDYATLEQLIILANMESINAECIKRSMKQADRIIILNTMAISQMKSLLGFKHIKGLKDTF